MILEPHGAGLAGQGAGCWPHRLGPGRVCRCGKEAITLASANLVGAVNHRASTNLTARELRLLLSGEPATSGGGVRESDDWTWDLSRYRPLQTFTSPDAQSYLIKLIWVLLARESTDRERQLDNQLTDLRAEVVTIGGRIDREIPENAVSAFKRQRVALPDGTYGYRVVRPEWENILTALRRGECNALMVPDIDRAMRDPRTLEDLIDVVEYYGVYVASLTGNIDLTTDAGISAARSLVNQRNQESRNTSRRVINGQRHAAMKGGNHGGRMRPFGWRKDRIHLNKREAAHIRREVPRILAGVGALTLAREWNARGVPAVTGVEWRQGTIRNMFLRPRICGLVTYQGEILVDADGNKVRGQWEPILTEEEYDAVVAMWGPQSKRSSRDSEAKGVVTAPFTCFPRSSGAGSAVRECAAGAGVIGGEVAIQPGWLGVRELGSGAGGGRGEGLVPDLL